MIASYNYIKNILEENKTFAKKKYGQNFLIDNNIADKIAKIASSKITIEIGPGLGSLTEHLLNYAEKVYVYEIDETMYEILNKTFDNKIDISLIDFLELDLNNVPYKNDEISVCSNLPYYVTTPILFKLFESDLNINKITVMVQKEVADRFKAKIGSEDYNALSIIVQYLFDVKYEMSVSKNVFYPKPNVDSAVISFIPKVKRNKEFEKSFFELVKLCFTQRRKTLFNNLRNNYDEIMIQEMFKELNLKDKVRPQELSLQDYLRIYEVLYER